MATRRRRRGYIEPLPSGSFRAVVYVGTDPLSGTLRYLRETASTYDDAEHALTKLLGQVDANKHPKTALTVAEAIEQWLDVVKLEETTRDRYEDLIRLYILPKFGAMQAGKVDAELLERFYARLERCRELCNGQPAKAHTCPSAVDQHDSQGALHHSRRIRRGRPLELPGCQPSRIGRRAGSEEDQA